MEYKKTMNTKQYYIAYFDILGYKDFFEDKEADVQDFLQRNISIINDTAGITNNESDISHLAKYKAFSDNCIILIEDDDISEKDTMLFLAKQLSMLQLKFLKDYKIPIRGAITKGEAFVNESIVFGKGLISVVELEGKRAIYPRIILDNTLKKTTIDYLRNYGLIQKDSDEQLYLDFFSLLTDKTNSFDIDAQEKNDIIKLCDQITALVKKYGHIKNNIVDPRKISEAEKTISKYLWLMTKYNDYAESKNIPVKIKHEVVLNRKIMKYEIEGVKRTAWPVVCV